MVSTGQVQPATEQNAGGVSKKNSPVLQTLPVSLPGGVGSVPEMGRLRDYSEAELKKYFPNQKDYQDMLSTRVKSMAGVRAAPSIGDVSVPPVDTRTKTAAGTSADTPPVGGVSVDQLAALREPEIDESKYHYSGNVEAWQRDYPNEFEEVLNIYADYYASQLWPGGQQENTQQDSSTQQDGQVQTVPANWSGGMGSVIVGDGVREGEGDEPEPTPAPGDESDKGIPIEIWRHLSDEENELVYPIKYDPPETREDARDQLTRIADKYGIALPTEDQEKPQYFWDYWDNRLEPGADRYTLGANVNDYGQTVGGKLLWDEAVYITAYAF